MLATLPYRRVGVAVVGGLLVLVGAGLAVARLIAPDPDPAAARGEGYEYLGVVAGEPVTWDACAPIAWSLDAGEASAVAVADIKDAIAHMEADSGFDFEPAADGTTPMLRIEIVDDAGSDLLTADDWGRTDLRHDGRRATSAVVALSIDGEGILEHGDGPRSWGGLARHELGHVLGLGHVDHPTSLMHPALELRPGHPGEGDFAGFADLRGRSSC